MRNVCPSQQRNTTVLKLDMVELMLEMFELYVEHERQVEREKKRKGSIVRVMEEVTRETPVYSPMEQKWVDLTKKLRITCVCMCTTMADTILVQLASAHLLAASTTELKTRALLDTGRCLRLLYKLHTIDPTGQWNIKPMTLQRLTEQVPNIDEATMCSV
ncbi:hypothetical protein LSAT2_014706 [Lamellibrachia satsuma]|nr:hypothetical protein LSAT2_014706 [Lamellibrachia satsuma]